MMPNFRVGQKKKSIVVDSEMKVVGWKSLHEFTRELFVRVGIPPENAEAEAEVLLWANLRVLTPMAYYVFVISGSHRHGRDEFNVPDRGCV